MNPIFTNHRTDSNFKKTWPTFEASDYGTVEFWLDAGYDGSVKQTDNTTDAIDGDTVGQWNDRSGNGNNFAGANGVKYRASTEPYHLEVTIDVSDPISRAGTYGAINTLFMVFDAKDSDSGTWVFVGKRGSTIALLIGNSGSSSPGDNCVGDPIYYKNTDINDLGSPASRGTVYTAFGGSAGLVLATVRYDNWNAALAFETGISFCGYSAASNTQQAKVYEIVMYDGDLSTANRQAVQQALVNKYSIV